MLLVFVTGVQTCALQICGVVELDGGLVCLAQVARGDDVFVRGDGVHAASPPKAGFNRSSIDRPRRWMRSSTSGHSSVRKRSRSFDSSFFDASSVTYIRSEEHTSELQSLMRISYAVFCLKKKNNTNYKRIIL